jgi:hypothetical protein
LIKISILFFLLSAQALACGVKNADGSYTYSAECHERTQERIKLYKKRISNDDLMIKEYDERIANFRRTILDADKRLVSAEKWKSTDRWVHVGLGFAAASLSMWIAAHYERR